jgi:hypothetical protein
MVTSPLITVGPNGMPPDEQHSSGGSFMPIPGAYGGAAGTPDENGMSVLSSLLDTEKQPDNEDDDPIECRLADEWIPPPEYQCYPISDQEARFHHSAHHRERKAIYVAYRSMGKFRPLHRFVNCGTCTRVLVRGRIGDEFEFRLVCERCHNRWCPACAKARSTIYAANIREWCSTQRRSIRFITLTLRHNDTPIKDQVDRINRSFLAIRRRSWWKSHVSGGVSFIEIKLGKDNRYHVHCHLIVEGNYMPVNELSDEWHAVTGDSPIVDVRAISNIDVVAGYVAKYGSKPIDRSIIFQPSRLIECIRALHGRRLATTFGSWKSLKLNQAPDESEPGTWQDVGSISEFLTSPWLEQMVLVQPTLAERIMKAWNPPNPTTQ